MQKRQIVIKPEEMLQGFGEYLFERENAKATVRKYMTDIKTFYRYLDHDYLIDKKRIMNYKE